VARDAGGLSKLTARYVDDNVDLWRRYGEGLRRLAQGAFPQGSSQEPRAAGAPDIGARARDLLVLSVTHYTALLRTYADFASHVAINVLLPSVDDAVRTTSSTTTTGDRPTTEGAQPEARNQIELNFTGTPGQTVSQSFVVANRKAADLDVTFELTEFVREDGRSRFRIPMTFVPERFVLPPGAEQVVECRIAIGEPFTTGARHAAMLRIPGFSDIQAVLIVMPRPAPVTPPATTASHATDTAKATRRKAASRTSPRKTSRVTK
jgi:hypothetical protein